MFAAWRLPGVGVGAVAVIAALVVLGGARASYWMIDGGGWLRGGGLASMGGVMAGLAAAWPLARLAGLAPGVLLDALVPAAVMALGIGRIGCFLAGCCYGSPTALPWGVLFPEVGGPPRHPLQLYSAAADVVIVWGAGRATVVPGLAAARTLAAFAVARIALETLRDPATTDAVPGLGVTVPQLCCGLLLLGVLRYLRHASGGLSRAEAHATVSRRMRSAVLLLVASMLGAAVPAAAFETQFVGALAVRPARGELDVASGYGGISVKRWRFTPGAGSDGIDPASEPIVVLLGTDEVLLPAGSVTASASARRYAFRDDTVSRGLRRLKLKRRGDGAWQVTFQVVGMDLLPLVHQFPRCEPLAIGIGNDAGASGVDLDRPRGAESPRLKVRGFCQIEGCPVPLVAGDDVVRPRHVICPF